MEPRLSVVTLGVADLDRAVRFYEAMGLKRNQKWLEGVAFFQLGGLVLSLFGRADLARDAKMEDSEPGFSGISLAYNARSESEVDQVVTEAGKVGGRIVKRPERAPWGGWSGYFADPDGHLWEVAYNEDFMFDERGGIVLPT